MVLIDVNVLVYAHRRDADRHAEYLDWLHTLIGGAGAFALAPLVLSGFLRIVTQPRVFTYPTPLPKAFDFVSSLLERPSCVTIEPGPRHWDIFADLCRRTAAKGNQVPDAYLAALAIESGSEWLTTNRDFARYPGLRWRHPLD